MTEENKNKEQNAFLVDANGNLHGIQDDSRFRKLPWYKKAICSVSKKYKSKFIDFSPIKMTITDEPIKGIECSDIQIYLNGEILNNTDYSLIKNENGTFNLDII